MNTTPDSTLLKLSQMGETVADRDDDIRDLDVKDRDGDDLGKVTDLLVDQDENRVRFMEVASGGFLGIGRDISLIPVDAIVEIADGEVRIDQTRSSIAEAPAYDPDLVRKREDYDEYLGFYGYPSWWAPGYQYPTYTMYR